MPNEISQEITVVSDDKTKISYLMIALMYKSLVKLTGRVTTELPAVTDYS